MGSSNKNGVDLGRINTCKIVGAKARHIEVRCREEGCIENCFECVDGDCVAQVGGQFNTMADCMANPLSNSCVTAGMVDSGIYVTNSATEIFYDWYFANHPNDPIGDYYYEIDEPCSSTSASGGAMVNSCVEDGDTDTGVITLVATDQYDWLTVNAPTGTFTDYYFSCLSPACAPTAQNCECTPDPATGTPSFCYILTSINVKDTSSTTLYSATTVGDLVTFLNGLGYSSITTSTTWADMGAILFNAGANHSLQSMWTYCGCAQADAECCYGPNGGILVSTDTLTIVETISGVPSQIGPGFASYNDLVVWANANGCPNVTTSMTYLQLITELSICLCDGQGATDTCEAMNDSGISSALPTAFRDWYAINQPSTPVKSWWYGYTSGIVELDSCLDSNGDTKYYMNSLTVYVNGSPYSPNFSSTTTSFNDLINWLIADGCTSVSLGMTFTQVNTEVIAHYGGGSTYIVTNGAPCHCTGSLAPTNTCDGKTDSGVVGGLVNQYDWLAANGHHATIASDFIFDYTTTGCPPNYCPATNGCWQTLSTFSTLDAGGSVINNYNIINDFIADLVADGISVTATDSWNTISLAVSAGTGSIDQIMGNAGGCQCTGTSLTDSCAAKIDSGVCDTWPNYLTYMSQNLPGTLIPTYKFQSTNSIVITHTTCPLGSCLGAWCSMEDIFAYTAPYPNSSAMSPFFNTMNDLVGWLQGQGCSACVIGLSFYDLGEQWMLHNGWDPNIGDARLAGHQITCVCSDPGGDPCDITLTSRSEPCICEGCGSGPGASWDCYESEAGYYCDDPGDGSGQYPTEQDCLNALAAANLDDCETNGNPSGAGSPSIPRVNAAAGTIFNDQPEALEYYGDPANGISGINAASLFFEVKQDNKCKSLVANPNTSCCEGPNSTVGNPTMKLYLTRLGYTNQWNGGIGPGGPTIPNSGTLLTDNCAGRTVITPGTNQTHGSFFDNIYTEQANGFTGLNVHTFKFENYSSGCDAGTWECCRVPGAPIGPPGLFYKYMSMFTFGWYPGGANTCANSMGNTGPAYCTSWSNSGPNQPGVVMPPWLPSMAGNTALWVWDDVLTETIANIPAAGVTMTDNFQTYKTKIEAYYLSLDPLAAPPYLHHHTGGGTCKCTYDPNGPASSGGGGAGGCCPSNQSQITHNNPVYVAWLNNTGLGWGSMYGMGPGGPSLPEYFTYDQILNDCMIQGVTGVTMSTPISISGNTSAPSTLNSLINDYLQAGGDPNHPCQNSITLDCSTAQNDPQGLAYCAVGICQGWDVCMCEASCGNITYDCDPKTCNCYDPFPLIGQYTGPNALQDCNDACCPIRNEDSWDCNRDGTCSDPGTGAGYFTDANSGGNPGDGLAACLASGGIDTCDTKTDISTSLAPNPCSGGMSCEIQVYNWHVTNGTTGAPWENYFYESATPNSNQWGCTGSTGGELHIPNGFSIRKQQIVQYTCMNAGCTVDILVNWCNTNIGPGFLNTMTWLQMEQHSYTIPGWEQSNPYANIVLSHTYCECTDCGGEDPDPWECVPKQGCIQQAGGQYGSLGACQAAALYMNSCNGNTIHYGGFGSFAQAQVMATTQANGYTNIDITTVSTYLNASWMAGQDGSCLPVANANECPNILYGSGNSPQISFTLFVPMSPADGSQLAGLQVSYAKWDDFLTDAQAIPIAGIGATTTFIDARNKVQTHYGSANGTILQNWECCECTEGCDPPEPPGRKDCLVLWLDALDGPTVALQGPPSLSGMTPIETVLNKAYNGIGLPIDMTAYYTWDTIDNLPITAPSYDTVTWPWHTFNFTCKEDERCQYLIANPNGPNPPRLQPDTTLEQGYGHGWTIFFHRSASAAEWINDKSWLMGDDWTVSDDANKQKASGLKPAGQPYCRSNYYGHNHADSTAPSSMYDASPLNEMNNTGYRTLYPGVWYLHWVIAREIQPYGTTKLFEVVWGIGHNIQFKDRMEDLDLDMVLANINTRNRGIDGFIPGQGYFSEIRAYNCAFDKYQIGDELLDFENRYGYGTLNPPDQLPPGCGKAFVSTVVDGVDNTHVAVEDGGIIVPGHTGFTAAFWIKMNDCTEGQQDACLFEKGINLPADNEQVAFRLLLTDDVAQAGNLYWDVFGDNPISYLGNYNRCISDVSWLGEESCAALVGKWKHIAVTLSNRSGASPKIYIDGEDHTGTSGSVVTGNVRGDSTYTLNIGDSSRVDYTTKGSYSQFMTWNTELTEDEVQEVYSNGSYFDPLTNNSMGDLENLGSPYAQADKVTFYTDMDSEVIKDLGPNQLPVVKYGGVTLSTTDTDPVDAGQPTDIPGLQMWLKAGTKILADQDGSNDVISRADYMLGDRALRIGDKIALWECYAGTGRYVAQISQTYKPKWEGDGTSLELSKGIYTDATDRLQMYHTRAGGDINIDAADGVTEGAFSMMFKVAIEGDPSGESVMGDTVDNRVAINNSTQLRVKLGGGNNKNFTIPAAIAVSEAYIFTITRDVDGVYNCYINGGITSTFDDAILTGSGTLIETNAGTIEHILGIPGVGMQGWFFDFMFWKDTIISDGQRKAMYRVMNEEIRII